MKKMLLAGVLALAIGCTAGLGVAVADIELVLLIENKTTRQSGTSISASPGDLVKFTLTVRNSSSSKVTADVNVVAGIPGCMIDETVSTQLSKNQKRKQVVSGKVPAGNGGKTLTVDVLALGSDGSSASAQGSVQLAAAKIGMSSQSVSPLQRLFLQMLARGLVSALASDSAPTSATLSEVKQLFRP